MLLAEAAQSVGIPSFAVRIYIAVTTSPKQWAKVAERCEGIENADSLAAAVLTCPP